LSGFLILNYTSSKHSDGVGAHTHSVFQLVEDNSISYTNTIQTPAAVAPTIPETNYYLFGMVVYGAYTLSNSTTNSFVMNAENVDINNGLGWSQLYIGTTRTDNENANGVFYGAARNMWTRWNGDPDPQRLNIKTARNYRLDLNPVGYSSMGYWYSYNTITYIVSGTCTGFSGNGSGIPVEIFRLDGTYDEKILELTTTTGGIFSGVWVDNTDTLYAAARQDDTHVGRSRNGEAG
jgi:hypothetical protein